MDKLSQRPRDLNLSVEIKDFLDPKNHTVIFNDMEKPLVQIVMAFTIYFKVNLAFQI